MSISETFNVFFNGDGRYEIVVTDGSGTDSDGFDTDKEDWIKAFPTIVPTMTLIGMILCIIGSIISVMGYIDILRIIGGITGAVGGIVGVIGCITFLEWGNWFADEFSIADYAGFGFGFFSTIILSGIIIILSLVFTFIKPKPQPVFAGTPQPLGTEPLATSDVDSTKSDDLSTTNDYSTEPTEMENCTNCGAPNKKDQPFCTSCGTKLSEK
ncbi:MAG: zinc-ribbon domain-containing protein [Candidatus Heimdallarchaeota archaeon]